MWYFAWMLGLPLAAVFAVMNAMWLELQRDRKLAEEGDSELVSVSQPDHKPTA
ncbi:MAG: cytochrome bd-I oxidase subunit CydX [Pseudomonadota bacterium]